MAGSTLRRPSERRRSAEDDAGTLEAVGEVEDLGHEGEAVGDVEGGGDDAGVVAEGCAEHLPEVALLGLGGNAGGGAGALAVDDDDGNLGLGGEAEAFGHEGEAAAGGRAHGANAGVGGADGHVDDADLVLDLADHDVGLAGVGGHPVEDAGGGAHGIGAVEFAGGGGGSHGHGLVAGEDGVAGVGEGEGVVEGLEILGGVVVASAGEGDVFVDDGAIFFAELLFEDALEGGEADAHHAEGGADGEGVLRDLVAADVGELGDGEGAELDTVRGGAGVDGVGVVEAGSAGGEEREMAIGGVLIEGNEEVEAAVGGADVVLAGADGEEGMAAADDGLIGVVGVEMKAATAEDLGEDVSGSGDALTGGSSDTDTEGLSHGSLPELGRV